jgi:hypothetical protein
MALNDLLYFKYYSQKAFCLKPIFLGYKYALMILILKKFPNLIPGGTERNYENENNYKISFTHLLKHFTDIYLGLSQSDSIDHIYRMKIFSVITFYQSGILQMLLSNSKILFNTIKHYL